MIPLRFFLLLFLLAPASAQIVVSGELTREFSLQPGGSAQGRILLHNAGTSVARAHIYQADYHLSPSGPTYGEPGHSPRSNAAWIEFDEREPELQPGETRPLLYKITAPSDAGLRGTYWSVIMVEPAQEERPLAPNEISVRAVVRYAVQIVAQLGSVSTPVQPALSNPSIEREGDRHVLRVDLSNPGERWLRPRMEVRLFDREGRLVTTLPSAQARIYPGSSIRQRFALDLPAGEYLALIVMDTGDALFGAQYRFSLEDISQNNPEPSPIASAVGQPSLPNTPQNPARD